MGRQIGSSVFSAMAAILAAIALACAGVLANAAMPTGAQAAGEAGGQHTVAFVVPGSRTATIGVDDGTPVSPAISDPTERVGYLFSGWYEDGAVEPYDFSKPVTADFTLTARWVADKAALLAKIAEARAIEQADRPEAKWAALQAAIAAAQAVYDNDATSAPECAQAIADLDAAIAEFNMIGPFEGAYAVYRVYNAATGEHHYTADAYEREVLLARGWNDEGTAWMSAAAALGEPVYRVYNTNTGEHHYTADAYEREVLVSSGIWNDEGIGWYSAQEGAGTEVHRGNNPANYPFAHHYTKDTYEFEVMCSQWGWTDEGIAWRSAE